ncbi:MAG: phenylalanine--tRNA ligase subunit beta [Candidatus Nanosynbacter sp. HMT-348_TM7c-JB]|nr:MAG: phenylalanine--tRNA ligase subunit beta [Candidatus Nanosynbacter sp. HMT-348_TM7c-JB]
MKVSLNIVRSLINFELPSVDELVLRVNQQLGGVEEVIDLGAKYSGARIVRVVECGKHPDADRLSVTKIDDGGAVPDVPRDDNGYVQVVCGAPNVHADMWAIWLPPGSTVPASFDDAEPFVLGARPLRGVLSQGMLAAADELAIGTDHKGIIEITENDLPSGAELRAGASFAEIFGLDDFVLDIENKMFTHRPDCFGQLGVAREIAGIFGQQFTSPEWYKAQQQFSTAEGLDLMVTNGAPELVPRFMAVAIKDVEIKPSPLWLQCQLVAMGGKPINNIVDATNYIMLMTAQPTHAYDYDKLRGHQLGARLARPGEKVSLLNGKEYELTADDIIIADGEGVIGLAGIMGGSNTEVSNDTKNIVLECATFDMYALRKTAMRHGVFTDALARFNKGQSPLQNAAVLKRLMSMVSGVQASEVFDLKQFSDEFDDYFDGKYTPANIDIDSKFINERLGLKLSENDICGLLNNVEIRSHGPEEELDYICIQSPFWRTDLELSEDIVEEVGRLYGFDKLPRELPHRSIKPVPKNPRRELKNAIRQSLSRAGANEILTYSFVHERILKNAEQDITQAYKLSNALSPDLQYYRLTVLPSLLDKVYTNIKSGHNEFALFEIGKGHLKSKGLNKEGLPIENNYIDLVYTSKKDKPGAPFYVAKKIIDNLGKDLGVKFEFEKIVNQIDKQILAPFDIDRSSLIIIDNGDIVGLVGELKQSVIKNFKLPQYISAASIDIDILQKNISKNIGDSYHPLSKFPSTWRDISIEIDSAVSYKDVLNVVKNSLQKQDDEFISIRLVDIYRAKDSSLKTITLNISMTNYNRTLTAIDASRIVENINKAVSVKLNGSIK